MTDTATGRTTGRLTAERRDADTETLPVVTPADRTTATPPAGTAPTTTDAAGTAPTTTDAAGVVTVNGVPQPWHPDLTVYAVVTGLLADGAPGAASCAATDAAATPDAAAPTGVAAALDDAIVPRGLWASTPVPAGARVEVVTAVQGG